MKFLGRMLFVLFLAALFCLMKPAAIPPTASPKDPYFLVLSYDQEFYKNSSRIIRDLLQQDLTTILGFKPAGIERAEKREEQEQMLEDFRSKLGQPEYIAPFKVEFSSLKRTYFTSSRGATPRDILALMKSTGRPVIILCDTYGSKILQELLVTASPNSVHSVILLNPSVNEPINYDAISHRMYNFYSKTGLAGTRKYSPEINGFNSERSKIVNIRCAREISLGNDEALDFSLSSIEQMNIPALIRLADQNYLLNWDLAAVTNRTAVGRSNYENIQLPMLFLNRTLEIDGNVVTNPQEKWRSRPLSPGEVSTVAKQLEREERYHVNVTTPCYDAAEQLYKCPSLKDVPYIKRVTQKKAPTGTALFVPAREDEGIYLVVFARSLDLTDFIKDWFTVRIGDDTKPCSNLVLLGKNEPVGQYTGRLLPYQRSLIDDPHYYAIAKFFISKEEMLGYAGQPFMVLYKGKPLDSILENVNSGNMPALARGDFDFVAYADVQKQNQLYPLDDFNSGSAVFALAEVLKNNEFEAARSARDQRGVYLPNSLQLVVGDLVRNGKHLNSWNEVLSKLTLMLSNREISKFLPFSLLATAIGTHDFADVDWGLLSFYRMVPTYGYLFSFNNPQDQPRAQLLEPQTHVNNTHLWFDSGRVRFIHLPYTTEEEVATADSGTDLSGFAHMLKDIVKRAGHPFNFDEHAIFTQFESNLKLAIQARRENKIDFIIVYGHAPIATAPQFEHEHPGLFNSLVLNDFKSVSKRNFAIELLKAMANAGVDLYLSGHNHQYDRCKISISSQPAVDQSFTAITIGLGTVLRRAKPNNKPNILSGLLADNTNFSLRSERLISGSDAAQYSNFFEHGFLPSYLKCQVRGKNLTCRLLAKGSAVLDEFTIKSRNP